MRTSYSSLDTYKTCPLKFKYQELDKIRVPKSIEAVFGSIMHSVLKYMFEKNPLFPTLDEIIDFFRNKWDEKKITLNNPEEDKMYFEEGINLIKKFYKANPPWNFNVVDMESRFEIEIEDSKKETHILAGIIDRIDKNDDSYEIIDYKTAKRMPSQDLIDKNLQMSIYHLGLSKRWPQIDPKNIKLSLYFLKHGEKISTVRNKKDLENTKKIIIKKINEIEEKIKNDYDFSPTPSVLCDWCGYRSICPMWRHLYKKEKEKIPNEKEIEAIISEYFELKSQNEENTKKLNELKSKIYDFMDNQKLDRVFGIQGYLTKKLQERSSYDMEKIKEILEPIGKWNEILSADEKKLEKIILSSNQTGISKDIKEKILALKTIKQFSVLTSTKKKLKEK